MSETDTSIATSDDLDTFSTEFFKGPEKPEEKPVEPKVDGPEEQVEDTSAEDDTLENEQPKEAESDEGSEERTDGEPEGDGDTAPKKPAKKTAQERINDITREKYEALREAAEAKAAKEALEQRLAALERSREDNAQLKTEQSANAAGAPAPTDKNPDGSDKYPLGEFDPAFIRDTARYEVRSEFEAERARQDALSQERERLSEEQRLNREWKEKVQASEVDVLEAQESLKPLMFSLQPEYGNYLASVIMSLDKGPEVFRYLADHLDEAERIISSGPTSATIALGRLESQFLDKPDQPKKKVTSAPKPPPTTRGSSGQYAVAPDTDDLDAFSDIFFKRK